MQFDLENLNPGTWFDLPDGSGRVCLRVASNDVAKEWTRLTVKKKVEFKQGNRFETEVINDDLRNELWADYCIVNWEGIVDKNNQPIPCSKENKIKLLGGSVGFSNFILEYLVKARELETLKLETETKN